jgi:hypothetical protein
MTAHAPHADAATLAARIAQLPHLPMDSLWALWDEHFDERPNHHHRTWLESRLAYKIQERALGGLKPATRRKLEEIGETGILPHHHFTPNPSRLGVFVSGLRDTAVCVRHAVAARRPEVARFDSLLLSVLSKPAPTSLREHTQKAFRGRDLHVRHCHRLSIALGCPPWSGKRPCRPRHP